MADEEKDLTSLEASDAPLDYLLGTSELTAPTSDSKLSQIEKNYKELRSKFDRSNQEWKKKEQEFEAYRSKIDPLYKTLEESKILNLPPEEIRNRIAFHDNLEKLRRENPRLALTKFMDALYGPQNGNPNYAPPNNGQMGNPNANWGGPPQKFVDEEARQVAIEANIRIRKYEIERDIDQISGQFNKEFGVEVDPTAVIRELQESGITDPNRKLIQRTMLDLYKDEIFKNKESQISEKLKRGEGAQVFAASGSSGPLEVSAAVNRNSAPEKPPADYNEGVERALAFLNRKQA